jgi:protein-L-isoaspartate(D-aspartate) O-methyltransferase
VVCADGGAGWPAGAPYDRIMLTVGAWDVAPAWVNQLAAGGRLVVPLSLRGVQRSVAFEPTGEHLTSVSVTPCGFMPLRGQMARPESIRPLGDEPGLFIAFDGEQNLAGFQKSATYAEQEFHAARSYSLIRPPRTE